MGMGMGTRVIWQGRAGGAWEGACKDCGVPIEAGDRLRVEARDIKQVGDADAFNMAVVHQACPVPQSCPRCAGLEATLARVQKELKALEAEIEDIAAEEATRVGET